MITEYTIVSKIGRTVWAPRITSRAAAEATADYLNQNAVFDNPDDRWVVEPIVPEAKS